jgi:thiosulfate/3-mercaptopyruvate sulfurtransferase
MTRLAGQPARGPVREGAGPMQNRLVAGEDPSSASGTYPVAQRRLPGSPVRHGADGEGRPLGALIVTASELARMLSAREPVTILDVRWRLGGPPASDDHTKGHVPGASFVDLDVDLAGPTTSTTDSGARGRHPMPDTHQFGEAMRRAGVRSDVPVVCYDERDSTSAARCWWLLSYFGHPGVAVLDGGLLAWTEAGGPLETGPVTVAPGDFTPSPGHRRLLVADDAARIAAEGILLDARSAERYRGDVEPIDPVGGHIPGAVSAPTTGNVDETGRFLGARSLRERFEGLGVTGERPVGAYCGSGVTAAHEVLALELAGIEGAGLYVGSWSEWSRTPQRPVATGPEP